MGFTTENFMTENQIRTQARRAQGETNDRLDALLKAQRRTNELLAQLVTTIGDALEATHTP
jgi:hypothetical protein